MIRTTHRVAVIIIVAVVVSMAILLPHNDEDKTKLKVFYAGSLIVLFEEIEKEFESKHPDVDVQMEGHGSIQVIRHLTDIHDEVDVLAVADHALIPDMMYPEYADWYITFATNEMVIAHTDESKYADEITPENWYEILTRPGVKFGFSNPTLDSCGYRALMVSQLAESYYNNQTIFDNVIACNFNPTFETTTHNNTSIIIMPEILKPETKKVAIRGGSVQLLALLDSGGIDYAFQYKSVAQQHGLRFVDLPPEIDLSSTEHEDTYNRVIIQLGFQRFASVGTERVGKPIFYAITISKNALHPEQAVEFVKFVISKDGQRLLQETKQPSVPPMTDNPNNLPEELRFMVMEIDE